MSGEDLMQLAQLDPGLSQSQLQQLSAAAEHPEVKKLLSGAAGATIGVVASKYMQLGRTAQVLLALAGFGVGRLVYDLLSREESRQFSHYNDRMNLYEIDRQRY